MNETTKVIDLRAFKITRDHARADENGRFAWGEVTPAFTLVAAY
jgi:hypothetical protein